MTTTRRSLRHAVRAALALAFAAMTIGVAPAQAASAIQVDARVLVGGRYEVGGWAAVSVTLVNEGTPTEGHLTAETDAGTVRRYVEMPAGARKTVTLYVRPGGFQGEIVVRYVEPNGTVQVAADVRVLDVSTRQVAIVGDPNGALRPQFSGQPGAEVPEPIPLAAADIPERPEPLAGIDVIVWAADSGSLDDAQRRSIERWIGDGGQLVVIGGADWQARTAGLEHLLPLEELAAVDAVDHGPLAAWAGADEPLAADTIATGELRDGARAIAASDDGQPMAAWHPVGAGRVLLFGSDLTLDAYRTWPGSPGLWSRVIGGQGALQEWFGNEFPQTETAGAMARALETLPALDVPPAELLLAVIVAYILLIGPVSYLVLRRIDRRELAWVTAPILVVVFSACSYGIGVTLKGTDVIVNQIAVVRSAAGATQATVESYAGVFSPVRGTYDIRVDADALVGRMSTDGFVEGRVPETSMTADQGVPARLSGLQIAARWFEYVRADTVVEHEPRLSVTWSSRGGDLVGTVTNVGSEPLSDVAYISRAGGAMVGDLAAGASGEFVIDRDGVSQSSASDQVYGFGGFSGSDADRRQITARRSVIDGLVGYGGWMPIGAELTDPGSTGPFLVGWRSGDGPSPIELEGVDEQRFAEIVEVMAIHPGIGQGEVVVGPEQMAIGVTTDGGASQLGIGTVSLGREPGASAVFDLSLPLEASGLAVSSVEVITGMDPSVIQDGGGFRGFWPTGWLVEFRDVRTGEWVLLGDLSEETRFTVDEPAAAVSPAGRIAVRVTAGEPDPNIGDPSIFVSARVTGVMEP